jgi:A/G-specific adenine glycosylase
VLSQKSQTSPSIRQFRRVTLQWHRRHSRSFPWRESKDPYEVLIGEVLLQRTRADLVAPVYQEFLLRWPYPSALAHARLSDIRKVIRPLGLAHRAHTIKALGHALAEAGRVPSSPQKLLGLPGVGPYTAHAVPIFAKSRNLPLVDWVIARVVRRYFGLSTEKRPNQDADLWDRAREMASSGRARAMWLGTLDFAASVCKPRPLCESCPLNTTCVSGRVRVTNSDDQSRSISEGRRDRIRDK